MNKNKTVQPLSENTRKAIIIAAIVVVAVIILSVALALILRPTVLSPDDQNNPGSGSSTLTIRNGDFAYTSSEDTAFPKTAQNWTKYGYKKASGSSHDFESITDSDKAVMGIVNVAEEADDDNAGWATVAADLEAEGLSVQNPGLHASIEDGDDGNKNVYMIATKEPTTASILSDSASVSSGASVKITIRLNTAQLKEGSEAVVMIQKSTVSAKATNWYAYNFHVARLDASSEETDANGWQELSFHIFNRDASTKYIRVSIGIGNVYSGEEGLDLVGNEKEPIKGEGILFIDDITYETKTANDYRTVVDAEGAENSTTFKIIENEDIVDESTYLTLDTENTALNTSTTLTEYHDAEDYAKADEGGAGYSPFTNRDDFFKDNEKGEHTDSTGFTIYRLSHDGSDIENPLALRLNASKLNSDEAKNITVESSLILKDHHHISFWVRVNQVNKAAYANVYVQKKAADNSWEDLKSGTWTVITTSQDIAEDANCGWVKYDVYLKPSATPAEVSILFVMGKNDTYTDEEKTYGIIPKGEMYVTSPAYEKIAYNDYNSASSGSYVKKLDLVGASASTTITNGSFSTLDSTGRQPSSWTAAFGGDNSIYRDGKGNGDFKERPASSIAGSGTVQNFEKYVSHAGTSLDDAQKNVLKIQNSDATSFGYYSADITLSARTAYVISAMFMTEEGLKPYIYLLNTDTSLERADRILTSVTSDAQNTSGIEAQILGHDYNNGEFDNGWMRYYMIIVTGNESMTVRLALFNGSVDGKETQSGTVYYDKVEMRALGTYSLVEADDDEKEENPEYETKYKVEWSNHPYINATKQNKELYGENFSELLEMKATVGEETLDKTWFELWGIGTHQPTDKQWEEMRVIPEKEEETPPTEEEPTTEPREVDWGLLFSVISSVAMVAALLVVVVVKAFKNKGKIKKAA